jgi:hypothetical protein
MKALRKILGLLIVLFIGLPILFAVIWAVGLTRAAVSPEFVSDLPQEIIEEVPSLIEEVFAEAQDEELITDEETRAWFKAASEVDISPRELMRDMGLESWLENELSGSLDEIGDVLRGKRRAGPIIFDMRPLKNALHSEDFKNYITKVMEKLPPCDEDGLERWSTVLERDYDLFEFPPCRPGDEVSGEVIEDYLYELTDDISDEIEIFSGTRFVPLSVTRIVKLLSYGMLLLPILIILLGSVIAATSTASFFRWSGLSLLAGGLISLFTALFTKQLAFAGIGLSPYSFSSDWSVGLHELVLEKTAWIQTAVVNHLFSPVIAVAGVVSIIGFIIFVLSFIASGKPKPVKEKPAEKQEEKKIEQKAEEKKEEAVEEKAEAGAASEPQKEEKDEPLKKPEEPEEKKE